MVERVRCARSAGNAHRVRTPVRTSKVEPQRSSASRFAFIAFYFGAAPAEEPGRGPQGDPRTTLPAPRREAAYGALGGVPRWPIRSRLPRTGDACNPPPLVTCVTRISDGRGDATMATVEHKTLTHDDVKAELDEGAQAVLGLSADEFIARYQAGDLDLYSVPVLRLSVLARLLLESGNGSNGHSAHPA